MRHEKRDMLEKLKDVLVLLHHKLASTINLDVYASWANALSGGKKLSALNMQKGTTYPIFVAPLPDDKYVIIPYQASR